MKSIIFGIMVFLACFSTAAQTPVYVETAVNGNGVVFARVVNATPYIKSCYISDQVNFTSFIVPANRYSLWYPVYGVYEWYCE